MDNFSFYQKHRLYKITYMGTELSGITSLKSLPNIAVPFEDGDVGYFRIQFLGDREDHDPNLLGITAREKVLTRELFILMDRVAEAKGTKFDVTWKVLGDTAKRMIGDFYYHGALGRVDCALTGGVKRFKLHTQFMRVEVDTRMEAVWDKYVEAFTQGEEGVQKYIPLDIWIGQQHCFGTVQFIKDSESKKSSLVIYPEPKKIFRSSRTLLKEINELIKEKLGWLELPIKALYLTDAVKVPQEK